MPKKTWVIPAGQSVHTNGGRGAWARPRLSRNRFKSAAERSLPTPTQRRSDLPTALKPGRTLTQAYFLGPLGALASYAGRANRFWLLTGISATTLALLTFWQGHDMAFKLERGSGYGVLWLGLWAMSWLGMCLAWSRGITMAGLEVGGGLSRLPKSLGNPWLIGVLGALFPGLGLLLSGYPRRAGWAVLGFGGAVLSALVLANGRALWKWNHVSHYGGFPPTTLEWMFIAAAGLGLIGLVGWLVQLLDGIRLAGRKAFAESGHGDAFAIALVTAMAAFAIVFRPAVFAAEFDHGAEWGQSKGLRITPLALAGAAMHLDPSRPDYAMRVADLEDAMGNKWEARQIRAKVYSDWAIYRAFAEPMTKKTRPARPDPLVGAAVPPPAVAPTAPALATMSEPSVPPAPEPQPPAEPVVKPTSPVKITAAEPTSPPRATATKPVVQSTKSTVTKKTTAHRTTTKTSPTPKTP
jgi:hypothetical protein